MHSDTKEKDTQRKALDEERHQFVQMLPRIERYLRREFRHLKAEALEEALAEATANCFVAFMRLCTRKRRELAYPTSLARFAARQVRGGRKVGSRLNVRDPLSQYAKLQKGIRVERLDRYNRRTHEWLDSLVEDRRSSIPDQVAMRIDVPAWFACLSRRNRKIAKDLASGFSTSEVARKHKLTPGRISQLRRALFESWTGFHEKTDKITAAA